MKQFIQEYCVGCGLCKGYGKAVCKPDTKGFYHPDTGDEVWLCAVCPAGGRQETRMDYNNIWGRTRSIYYGWATDQNIRKKASSGGVITEIASWMLDHGKADVVLHICSDPKDPTRTICCESVKREEVVLRSGSRYAISHPLEKIASIDKKKRYVVIGKPCDIVALKNYMEIDAELKKSIVLTLSFFCAGLPSIEAQEKLLKYIQCPKDKISSLRYRGDGWPGKTTAVDNDGNIYSTDYSTAWGHILGRDIMKMCRVCLDGIGEAADISCADAWYLTADKKPVFSEEDGRNIVFARSETGSEILNSIIGDQSITVVPAIINDLKYMQTYQWNRRATMVDKILAMRFLGKTVPNYSLGNLSNFSKEVSLKTHIRIFFGTIKRILKRKI